MRIGRIDGPATSPAQRRTPGSPQEPVIEETRALIAIEAAAPGERAIPQTRHPAAPFLAHLIATQMQAPQTRARRRAEPAEAVSVYLAPSRPRFATGRRLGRQV